MARVATYVFLDLETTGIPSHENNLTKITELSLVAVKRDHVLETRPGSVPRVQNKLTLCFNPGRVIPESVTRVTGLCNYQLEYETSFNKQASEQIIGFLNLLTKPVCFIAQNGIKFDYPILRKHFERVNVSLPEDLLCADCLHAFYDIMEEQKRNNLPENQPNPNQDVKQDPSTEKEIVKEEITSLEDIKDASPINPDELFVSNTLDMKSRNENTPKQVSKLTARTPIKGYNKHRIEISKARRKFPWSDGAKPKEKYKLKDIYERLLSRPPLEAHRAENDCIMALECAIALAKPFVTWVDENYVSFCDIKPIGY